MVFTHPLVVASGGGVHLQNPVALWLGNPSVAAGSLLLLGAYLLVIGPLRTRFEGSAPVPPARVVSFTLGVVVMFVTLTGPVHELGDCCLFSVHMVQHLMVTMVMPPLLLVGTPAWFFRAFARLPVVGPLGRALTRPVPAFLLCNVFFAASHIIPVYDLQMRSHPFHIALHLSFMVTGVLMWWPVAAPAEVPGWPRLSSPVALLYLFFQLVPAAILGALIAYADEPLYRWYVAAPRVTSLSPLSDQLLGALIMWVGGGFFWLGAMTVVFFLWSKREEDEARGGSLRHDLTAAARR